MQQTWRQETSLQRLKRRLALVGQQLRLHASFLAWSEELACSTSAWQATTQGLLAQKYALVRRSSRLRRLANQKSAIPGMSENVSPNKQTRLEGKKGGREEGGSEDDLVRQQARSPPVSHQQRLVLKRWWQFLARYASGSGTWKQETLNDNAMVAVSGLEPACGKTAYEPAAEAKENDESRYSTAMGSTIGAGPLYLSALDQAMALRPSMPIAVLDTAFQPLHEQPAFLRSFQDCDDDMEPLSESLLSSGTHRQRVAGEPLRNSYNTTSITESNQPGAAGHNDSLKPHEHGSEHMLQQLKESKIKATGARFQEPAAPTPLKTTLRDQYPISTPLRRDAIDEDDEGMWDGTGGDILRSTSARFQEPAAPTPFKTTLRDQYPIATPLRGDAIDEDDGGVGAGTGVEEVRRATGARFQEPAAPTPLKTTLRDQYPISTSRRGDAIDEDDEGKESSTEIDEQAVLGLEISMAPEFQARGFTPLKRAVSRDYPVNTRRQALVALPLQSTTPIKLLELAMPAAKANVHGRGDTVLVEQPRPTPYAQMTKVLVARYWSHLVSLLRLLSFSLPCSLLYDMHFAFAPPKQQGMLSRVCTF